jgi:replication-associated recombination protein RarA
LGIANKKIEGIKKDILNSAIYGKRIKILLLTGPAGIGKSTLVQILCKELGLEITEWLTSKRLSWDDARYGKETHFFK